MRPGRQWSSSLGPAWRRVDVPTIREAVLNWLTRDPGVNALAAGRISPVREKQRTTYPNITYERTSGLTWGHLSGLAGVSEIAFRVACWSAVSEFEAASLAAAVKAAMDRYRGGQSGVMIQFCRVRDVTDAPVDPFAGDDVGLFCE